MQPEDAAELPDSGPVEWAPLAPYWSVLWRSGVALARELDGMELRGRRVLELGCGLGVPSLAAARAGADVLATDACSEALALVARNARLNGVRVETAVVDWKRPRELVRQAPFDLVLAADVLYERAAVGPLLALLPRLAPEAWLADPGRPAAEAFLDGARRRFAVATGSHGVVRLHRLRLAGTIERVPDRLYFTESDEANALIASDPMALLVGFELDQRVTVMKAFEGPLALKQRLGAIDAATLAAADLEPVFFEKPVIHRYPRSMAKRVHELAVHVRDQYDGEAARVWTDAADSGELRANIAALPGFGPMKIESLGAVLSKHFGVEAAHELVPAYPTLGDVDSPQALEDYQEQKRLHKAEWAKARAGS